MEPLPGTERGGARLARLAREAVERVLADERVPVDVRGTLWAALQRCDDGALETAWRAAEQAVPGVGSEWEVAELAQQRAAMWDRAVVAVVLRQGRPGSPCR